MDPIDPEAPETQPAPPDGPRYEAALDTARAPESAPATSEPFETRVLLKVLIGPQGLRAGWSVLLFIVLYLLVSSVAGFIFFNLHLIDPNDHINAGSALFTELPAFLGVVAAAAIVALIERRRGNLLAYNLTGPRRSLHFFEGLAVGFAALSVLIGTLAWGGWLHFGPIALSGSQIFKFAGLWGITFLLVGCVEEGIFRCYLQFTLTRGINFWWALGIVGAICLELKIFGAGNGVRGIYIFALLGLVPCMLLHFNKAEGSNFWQAAWVSSTVFGFIHTGNNGENWLGIFAVAVIGFVWVVSIRMTGSAWWAIGCHVAWDWAETYFYGAADSGNVGAGHYLTTTPSGPAFWSGGADGPEGSVLVLGVLLLLLVTLVALYGRKKPAVPLPAEQLERAAG